MRHHLLYHIQEGVTALSGPELTKRFSHIDGRIHELEELRISWEAAVSQLGNIGIERINNVILPLVAEAQGHIDTMQSELAAIQSDWAEIEAAWAEIQSGWAGMAEDISSGNLIHNPNFDWWPRGTTFIGVTNQAHTAARWRAGVGAGDTINVSRQVHTPGQSEVPGNPKFFYRHTVSASVADTIYPLEHRIPGVATFADGSATVDFWVRSDLGLSIKAVVQQNFGSGGSATVTVGAGDLLTMSPAFQRYSHTFDIPSIVDKTVGSDDYLRLYLQVTNPTNQTGYIDLSQMQFRRGDQLMPFSWPGAILEKLRCMPFVQTIAGGWNGLCWDASSVMLSSPLFPPMRKTPVASLLDTSILIGHGAAGSQTSASSAIVTSSIGANGLRLRVNGFSALTSGDPCYVEQTGDWLLLDAEL